MRRATLSTLLVTALLACTVYALTLRRSHWKDVLALSERVVVGRVAGVTSEPTEARGCYGVQTRVTLIDNETLWPAQDEKAGAVSVEFVIPGGTCEGRRVRIPGAPQFAEGEHLLVCLRTGEGSSLALAGYGLGVLRTRDGELFKPDVPSEGGPLADGETLADIRTRLRALGYGVVGAGPAESSKLHQLCLMAGLAFFLLWLACKYRPLRARSALLLGLLCVCLAESRPVAREADGTQFVLSGQRWNLQQPQGEHVFSGRVLWTRGAPTPELGADETFSVIHEQFQQWENIPESAIRFAQYGRTIESGMALDEQNVVSFQANPPRAVFDRATLAVTFVIADVRTGRIVDADIVFNDRDVDWVLRDAPISVQTVGLHEIGHFLGLEHTTDTGTVMFPTALGLTTLSPGDQRGAITLYPVGEEEPSIAVNASSLIGAAPFTVQFSAAGSESLSGQTVQVGWDFGDGTTSTSLEPEHTFATPGTYTVKVSITDPNAGRTSASFTVVVTQTLEAVAVSKFAFSAELVETLTSTHRDSLSFTLNGASVAAGDRLQMYLGSREVSGEGGFVLDQRLRFTGGAEESGRVSVKGDAARGTLALAFKNARALGALLDPRGPDDVSQNGTGSLPVRIIVTSTGGATRTLAADVNYAFTIRTARSARGLLEKSIRGKQ